MESTSVARTPVQVVKPPALPEASYTLDQLERIATWFAGSKLFAVQTKEAALALFLIARAEGRDPILAARDYHIIENRPALKADAMLARFFQAGGAVQWHEISDTRCKATFAHHATGQATIDWTMADATQAGLTEKPSWKKYPRAMLRSRCVSEGIRTIYPQCIVGTYTPEELADGDVLANELPARPGVPTTATDTATGESIAAVVEPLNKPSGILAEGPRADHMAAMEAASTMEDLQKAHAIAYKAAYDAGDIAALKLFDGAKVAAKKRLTPAPPSA